MRENFNYWRAVAAALCLGVSSLASAALFGDDEARRAIIELRQRIEAQQQASQAAERQLEEQRRTSIEDTSLLRRAMLDLQTQIETLNGALARLHGQNEQLLHEIAELQRRNTELAGSVEGLKERLRKLEPSARSVDGREFIADPVESRDFEAALAAFRRSDFPAAQAAFAEFVQRYPQSGFRPTALFWLGHAQYANRDCQAAIENFRSLLAAAPDYPRAPEAVLSIANCQIELKDNPAAVRTLDELVQAYPQSEAAVTARERLVRLR